MTNESRREAERTLTTLRSALEEIDQHLTDTRLTSESRLWWASVSVRNAWDACQPLQHYMDEYLIDEERHEVAASARRIFDARRRLAEMGAPVLPGDLPPLD